ncbi:MAG TPA: hypothetical protein VHL98_15430 [Microvirga sp.]|jgi:hypothetical protein|nr:hypothetical protein [Microvirga sp.]
MGGGHRGTLLAVVLLASTHVAAQTSLLDLVRAKEPPQASDDAAARADGSGSRPVLGEQQVRAELHERGIVAITAWRREGPVYRARAEWYGEPVDLHVDAATGVIRQPERLKGAQIVTMLKVQGWRDVREVTRGGDTFRVRAERDRRVYDLKIDSKTGTILAWQPA